MDLPENSAIAVPIDKAHRRFNPLTGEYVLVSPQRATRPWQGSVERMPAPDRPQYDPGCYLCPGNARSGGIVNPDYAGVFVFTNDFPALLDEPGAGAISADGLLRLEPARGTNRVICYSPRHDQTLAGMDPAEIEPVVDCWIEQYRELGARYRWVQVFQNQGEMMGASNPHPHGQIWAVDALPNEPAAEDRCQRAYLDEHGSVLLEDYLRLELDRGERLVLQNDHWAVLVPFWAVWPFETLILPKRAVRRMEELNRAERAGLAQILGRLLAGCDRLFDVPFPHSLGWHPAPYGAGDHDHWLFHGHLYPPLLRSATVRKFMVGYELLAEAQRDLTPEQAAAALVRVMD